MKVIFMGTSEFAVLPLKKLIDSPHEIIAVYTKPPKAGGRGYKEIKSPIHQLAEANNLTIYTPETFKLQDNVDQFINLNSDVAVVASYGLILRKVILDTPKFGCLNIHPSLLPRWRGAAPIQHTIINGDTKTAVCIMQMDEGLDTGDILLQQDILLSIGSDEDEITAYDLQNLTSEKGGALVLKALENIQDLKSHALKQSDVGITYATKLTKNDEKIDWYKSSFLINCQIRALTPKPSAYFIFNNEKIKIIKAEYSNERTSNVEPGTVIDNNLTISCKEGNLHPKLLQREGKKMIYTDAFLRGFAIPEGSILK